MQSVQVGLLGMSLVQPSSNPFLGIIRLSCIDLLDYYQAVICSLLLYLMMKALL